jgi:epoxyqueuosine reductase
LVCPWNRFSKPVSTQDFQPRHSLDDAVLTDLFSWSESEFNTRLEGSPIRRIGYQRWLRNIAVALGNSKATNAVLAVLEEKKLVATPMVREHIEWAIAQLNDPPVSAD